MNEKIPLEAISRAVKKLREEGINPTQLIVNPSGYRKIRGGISEGIGRSITANSQIVGTIFGIQVIISRESKHEAVLIDENKMIAESIVPEFKAKCGICAILGKPCPKHKLKIESEYSEL